MSIARAAGFNNRIPFLTGVRVMMDFPILHRLPARVGPSPFLRNYDVPAAVAAGLVAGTIAIVAMLAMAMAVYDESPWKMPRMIAAIAMGPSALQPEDEFAFAVVATGILLHFALALVYSFALALLVKDPPDAAAPWIGLAFGVALYFANLHGFTRLFPWFVPMRTLDTLGIHALFGIVAATTYKQLAGTLRR